MQFHLTVNILLSFYFLPLFFHASMNEMNLLLRQCFTAACHSSHYFLLAFQLKGHLVNYLVASHLNYCICFSANISNPPTPSLLFTKNSYFWSLPVRNLKFLSISLIHSTYSHSFIPAYVQSFGLPFIMLILMMATLQY